MAGEDEPYFAVAAGTASSECLAWERASWYETGVCRRGITVSLVVSKKPRTVRNIALVSIQQARMQPSQLPASISRFRS